MAETEMKYSAERAMGKEELGVKGLGWKVKRGQDDSRHGTGGQ